MKRLLIGWLCLFIVGCGAATDTTTPETPVGDPARITPAIRDACGTGIPDANLASAIAGAEIDRDNGVTKADELAAIYTECDKDPNSAAVCRACLQAIVDEAFGPG